MLNGRNVFWNNLKPELENIPEVDVVKSKRTNDDYWYEVKLKDVVWEEKGFVKAPFSIGLSIADERPAIDIIFNKHSTQVNLETRNIVYALTRDLGSTIEDRNIKNRKTCTLKFRTTTQLTENNFDIVKSELIDKLKDIIRLF